MLFDLFLDFFPLLLLGLGIFVLAWAWLLVMYATPWRIKQVKTMTTFLFGLVLVTALLGAWQGWAAPRGISWFFWLYGINSVLTFIIYAYDKRASRMAGARRVEEQYLHFLELLGGWPGAYVGSVVWDHKRSWNFEHKTRQKKIEMIKFRLVRFFIALLHVAVWGWFLTT